MAGLQRVLVLVLLGSAVILANEQNSNNVTVGTILGTLINGVGSAAIKTLDEEKKSVSNAASKTKTAISNACLAGVDCAKATCHFYTIIPKSLIFYLTGSDSVDAIKRPVDDSFNSFLNALGSIKNMITSWLSAGLRIAKAGWDLSVIVPKFGINLLTAERQVELVQELQSTFEKNVATIEKVPRDLFATAEVFCQKKDLILDVSSNVSSLLPPITSANLKKRYSGKELLNELTKASAEINHFMKLLADTYASWDEKCHQFLNLGLVSSKIIFQYAGLVSTDNRENFIPIFEELMANATNLIESTINDNDADGDKNDINNIFVDLKNTAESVSKLYEDTQSCNQPDELCDKNFLKFSEIVKKFIAETSDAVKQASMNGMNLVSDSKDLITYVPKFGFGLLWEHRKEFTNEVSDIFKRQKDSVMKIIAMLQRIGSEVLLASKRILQSTLAPRQNIPRIAMSDVKSEKIKDQCM